MPTTPLPRRRDRSPGKDRARAIVKAWENGAPRLRVGRDGVKYDANPRSAGYYWPSGRSPVKEQQPSATKAKTTKPSAAIPALPAARILRLTQLLAFVDYCAGGAMRTVLPLAGWSDSSKTVASW